jgi:hypothetical protein
MEKFLTIRGLNDLPHGEISYYKETVCKTSPWGRSFSLLIVRNFSMGKIV